MADLVAAATLLFRDRFSAPLSAAARQTDRVTDRMVADSERMARTTSRAADRAGRAAGGLAHDTRGAGRQAGRSTRLMSAAWKGLDILDDISGVASAVTGLASGFVEAASEAVAMSRDVELAVARIASLEAAAAPGADGVPGTTSTAAVLTHARLFATGRGGAVSEVVGLNETDFIAAAKEALSAGFEESAAVALTKYAAGLGVAAEGSMGDAARLLRPMYALLADPAADAEAEVARLADQVARTQALYDIPSLPLLTEAITTAAPLAGQHGIASDVLLGALGAFHSAGTSGSEAGEAFNSILEEITSGMEELGLAKVETAGGGMDFPATVARLREYRMQSGLSDTAWVDRLVDVFGELGGRQLATITSEQTYQRFTGGLPEIAESEGVVQRRLAAVADTREMRRARLDAQSASNKRVFADTKMKPLDNAWLGVREWWQRRRTAKNDMNEYRSTGYHSVLRPAGIELGLDADSSAELDRMLWLESTKGNHRLYRAIPETLAKGVEQGGPALGAALDRTLQREVDERLPHSDARRGVLSSLTASGRAIPETLAAGVEQGGAALGAALDRTLQREVGERLPHSDARRGPFADLTASGRAAPETLAAGVKQGSGALEAAVTTALPAPPAISLLEPPTAPVLPPMIAASAAAELEPPALPALPPLVADSYAADLEPPAAPFGPPPVADPYAADLDLPAPQPLSAAPSAAPPLRPQSPAPSELLAAVRDLTREIRRLRTENGAGVTIEHVELHADDADLMRAAEGLAALRGGP